MSLNVIDLIKGQLGPALVSQSATQLGESESGVSKAISALLPAVVSGLADNTDKPGVIDAITDAPSSGLLGNLLGGASGNSMVATILSAIFGDRVPGLVNAVSEYSGVSNTSANSLLYMVTGASIGSIGKYAEDHNHDASGITTLLNDQKGLVSSLLPAGLSLASLGVGYPGTETTIDTSKISAPDPIITDPTPAAIVSQTPTSSTTTEGQAEVTRAGNTHVHVDRNDAHKDSGSIWKWLLPLILLALAAWFLWRQCDKPANTTTAVTDSTAYSTDTALVVADNDLADSLDAERASTVVSLPGGQTLDGYEGGIEDQIVTFLNSEEYKTSNENALKDRWFNFDNLNFEFNSTQLTPESQVQLDNIKAILAAYPDAKIKIGAYTDKKGDEAANKKLSQDRANAVKAALNSAQVISAEGYGEEFATVDESASDEAREIDRKTAIRFTK